MRLFALSAVLLTFACGTSNRLLPDGGRERLVCTTEFVHITVRVVDTAGVPVEGALVLATNSGSNKQATAQTRADGITTALGEDLGPGTVVLRASKDARVSDSKQVSWTCGECHCTADPDQITLTMSG